MNFKANGDSQKMAEALRNIEKQYNCSQCEQEFEDGTKAVKHHIQEHQKKR